MTAETLATANVKQAVPFFRVADMETSLRFYLEGLGFELTNHWMPNGKIEWCLLQLGGAALMLQEFPRDGHDSWVAQGKVGEGVTIYFICEDALAIYRDITVRGIAASRPFVGNGMWVVGLNDPDGYRLEFESNTDAEEDSEYAD